jgi:toxin ParE1/3/4
MHVIIAPRAQDDIEGILAWTLENFGPQTLERYAKLIQTAIEDVGEDPELAGSVHRPEIAKGCRTYHLFHSRKRAGRRGQRVRNPRHLLLYRKRSDETVEIGRVLHDTMDFEEHLPTEYRAPSE